MLAELTAAELMEARRKKSVFCLGEEYTRRREQAIEAWNEIDRWYADEVAKLEAEVKALLENS